MTQTPASIGRLLQTHGIAPRKRLGQHFLADPNIIRKMIVTSGVSAGDNVLEVGAGTGALTIALAEAGAHVLAYEVDPGLRPLLEQVVGERAHVDLRFEDALDVLPADLGAGPWKMVANLPYNVGTRLLLMLVRHAEQVTDYTVMVQREVADRLIARPGTKAYGLPSIVIGLTCEARMAFTVPPQVFYPPPRVSSAVVVLRRRRAPADMEQIIELAGDVFRHRRKMLRSSIDPAVLERAGVDPGARPEDLAPEKFVDVWEATRG
jgi:16S rRNA (adenine1518-N6/adenine1519-N6)-dimethyltransferase